MTSTKRVRVFCAAVFRRSMADAEAEERCRILVEARDNAIDRTLAAICLEDIADDNRLRRIAGDAIAAVTAVTAEANPPLSQPVTDKLIDYTVSEAWEWAGCA